VGGETVILETGPGWKVVRQSNGAVVRESTGGASIPETLEYALKPNRPSWEAFKKMYDANWTGRLRPGWQDKAEALNKRDRAATFLAGSLYGWPREWMGVEELSCLPFDDPAMFEEILDFVSSYFMAVHEPILKRTSFDFAYIFEDCCFKNGPLLSPLLYNKFYDKYYRRLVRFYKERGVEFILLDSDGKIDDLIPYWLDSGIDILFPIEVGTWQADAFTLRKKFGKRLRMMGGLDKRVMHQGEKAMRAEMERLKPAVLDGGYIPLPDHRIPPDVSLDNLKTYTRLFKEVFGGAGKELS
jgi:uroporphyrinogen decarboxylase